MPANRRPRIALLAAPESSPSILYGLYDVLASVGPMWPDMLAAESAETLLDVSIVAASREPFRCFGNILVEPHAALGEVDDVDVVVVCDMYTPIDRSPHGTHTAEVEWLRRMHARGTLVSSVCTGSLLLAEAGLLDGRSCAGHWAYADLFRAAYPRVRFEPRAILDLSSEGSRLITAGGVTSWEDLALHLIVRFCSPEDAVRTARVYLLGGHEAGQLPFSAMTEHRRVEDRLIGQSLAWIAEHYAVASPVSAMVDRSGLTKRTFARRFAAVTGRTPIAYVHAIRIEGARRRLESESASVDDVGFDVGYEDPTFFRRLFKRSTGMTPAAYRRKFAPLARA